MPLTVEEKKRIEEEENNRLSEEEKYREEVHKKLRTDAKKDSDHSITEETNNQEKKSTQKEKDSAPQKSAPFHDAQILSRIFWCIILLRGSDILAGFIMQNPRLIGTQTVAFLLWLFLGYKLTKHRRWARNLLVFLLFVSIGNGVNFYQNFEDVNMLIYATVTSAFLGTLLLVRLSRRNGHIVIAGLICFVLGWLAWVGLDLKETANLKQKLQHAPATLSQTSPQNYSITLPNNNWVFVSKKDFESATDTKFPEADLFFATRKFDIGGVAVPESKSDLGVTTFDKAVFDKAKKHFKKELKEWTVLSEKDYPDGFDILFAANVGSFRYRYVKSLRALSEIVVTTVVWGEEKNVQKIVSAANVIVNSIKETPLKSRLKKLSGAKIFEKYEDAVTLIRVYDDEGEVQGFGTGFNIHPNGLIVTNTHVVFSGGTQIDVKFPKHGTYEDVGVIGLSKEEKDITLLRLNAKSLPYMPLNEEIPVGVGDKVFVIGNPQGLVNTLSEGIVSGIRGSGKVPPFFQITAPISPGSSGGPVLNEFGQAVGVATLYLKGSQNLNFAVSVGEIENIKILEEQLSVKSIVDYLKNKEKEENKKVSPSFYLGEGQDY